METQHYNKLVRDKIPEIIIAAGQRPTYHTLSDADYFIALKQKLQEEVTEFDEDPSIEELADLLEVIFAIAQEMGSDPQTLEDVRLSKFNARGGFKKKLYLSKVEIDETN